MKKKDIIYVKKTDNTLQFWPKGSSEVNLTESSKPEELKKAWPEKIKVPQAMKTDFLKQRGIIEAAFTSHAKGFYQYRDKENFTFITITVNGCGQLEYDGKKYALAKNTILIAPQGSTFILKNRGIWNFLWFHLKSKQWLANCGKTLRIVKSGQYAKDIIAIANLFINNVYRQPHSETILNNLAETLESMLLIETKCDFNDDICKKLSTYFDFFKHNPSDKTTAKAFAKKIGVSIYDVNKASLKISSLTFAKKQLAIRLNIAKASLQNGCNIRQSAEKAGFKDRYTFSKIFKREIGISPSKI